MADLTVTAANVAKGTGAQTMTGTAGATITAGQPVYADPNASFTIKPAQATSQNAAKAVGIALHAALSGQPITYITQGQLTSGATNTVGIIYAVSATAGGIAPNADLVSTNYVTVLGIAISASIIDVLIHIGNVAKP